MDDLFITYVPGDQRTVLEVTLTGKQILKIIATSGKNKGSLAVAWCDGQPDLSTDTSYRVALTRGVWTGLQGIAALGLKDVAARPRKIDIMQSMAAFLIKRTGEK